MPSGKDPLFFGSRARTRMNPFPILLAILVALTATVSVAFSVSANDKVFLCHAVAGWGEGKTGYNFISVSENALNGHYVDDNRQGPLHSVWNTKFDKMLHDFFPSEWQVENRTCGDKPDEPPPPVGGGGVEATAFVCGDPRVYLTTYNDTKEPQPILIRFVSAKTGEVVRLNRIAPVGTKTFVRFWVKGRTMFFVKYDGEHILDLWTGPRNNIGACPRG